MRMLDDVYRRDELRRLIDPASVAIIGASARAGSFGDRVLKNMAGFTGRIHLVNARYDRIGERPCFPSVAALPEVPDCAVITVGREAVEEVLAECVAAGVGGAIVYASGYAETGKPGRAEMQAALGEISRRTGLRIIGPNCIGIVNWLSGAAMTFSGLPRPREVRPGAVGLISQSGALGFALAQAVERGVNLSHVLTSGNSVDVDMADYVAYLAEDPACRAIACVFEGMATPLRLIRAAEIAWAADKPLVIYKMATGQQGAAAALSHTGSLAGSEAAYAAAFARAGVIQLDRFEDLIDTAAFFAKAPPPRARGAAVIATSGGAAIMAADKAEIYGVGLPQPGPAAREVLEARIPEFGSPRNPCDVTAQVLTDPASLSACAGALLEDPAFGVLITPHVFAYDVSTPRIRQLGELAEQHGKMVCNVWLTEWREGPGALENAAEPRNAAFRSMDGCMAALAAWHRRDDRRRAGPRAVRRLSPETARAETAAMIAASPTGTIAERAAKSILAHYGVPVVGETLARSAAEAVAAAASFGGKVALKVESPAIPHKTDAGVLRLDLEGADAVRDAFGTIMARARALTDDIAGVLVQPMLPAGAEIMVGARVDPLFGPLVVVGSGGILVELLADSAVGLAPLTEAEAGAMLRGLKGARLLQGFRGAAPVDIDELARIVVRIGEFIADHADSVTELDVNPLICAEGRIMAVDALIVRGTIGAGREG
jgi:acyl-CoA synthetase (NDP forming)